MAVQTSGSQVAMATGRDSRVGTKNSSFELAPRDELSAMRRQQGLWPKYPDEYRCKLKQLNEPRLLFKVSSEDEASLAAWVKEFL